MSMLISARAADKLFLLASELSDKKDLFDSEIWYKQRMSLQIAMGCTYPAGLEPALWTVMGSERVVAREVRIPSAICELVVLLVRIVCEACGVRE